MADDRLPWLDRVVLALLLRGDEADVVMGDIVEGYAEDLATGESPARARKRLHRQVITSCWEWWRPGVIGERFRADPSGRGTGHGFKSERSRTGDRETGRGMGMGNWVKDLKVAARSLKRRPGFALGVALILGLGIGATTTIYSVVDGVMLRPLPYEDPSTLVAVGAILPTADEVHEASGLQELDRISMLNYQDFESRTRSFRSLAVIAPSNIFLPDRGDGPEKLNGAGASPELFEILGVTPALGRTFLPEEYSVASEAVAMITYGAWQRRYGGDPNVEGRSLEIVGNSMTIVGVLPRDFTPPEAIIPVDEAPEVWTPVQPDHRRYQRRAQRSLYLLGQLNPGTSVDQARSEAENIAAQLALEFPEDNVLAGGSHIGIGLNSLHAQTVGGVSRALGIFLGAAGLLLLLAAMNAATLLFARALDRRHELGVRMALGAGRGRVVRLLVGEAGILAVLGGAFGVLLAYGGVGVFLRFAPSSIPRLSTIGVDARVLAVAAIVSLGTGVAAGLLPALRLTRRGPWERLSGGGRSFAEPSSRLRAALVGGQIAVAVVLLSGAGLLFGSFVRIRSVEPGFEADGLVTLSVGLEGAMRAAAGTIRQPWQGWDLLVSELEAVPGVESVAAATNIPFQSPSWSPRLLLPGDTPETLREGIAGYAVTPGYFGTMGTVVLQGRGLERLDGPDAEPVVVVNQSFVRTQMRAGDPLGTVVRRTQGTDDISMRIVGVVEDVVQARAEDGPRPAIYVPYTQYVGIAQAVVRTSLPTEVLGPELRRAAARFNPIEPAEDILTMRDRMAATRTTPRFQALLIGAFALVALLLAAAGLYGSLAHSVRRRERELGVRMALGADRGGVLKMILGQGLRVSAAGLVVGMIAALAFTRVLAGLLYGVEPHDPATLAGVSVVLVVVSIAACLAPARRATAVDPVTVLKAE